MSFSVRSTRCLESSTTPAQKKAWHHEQDGVLTLPLELDAAPGDGFSTVGIFYRICVPIIEPALGNILVFSFMHH